MEMTNVTLPAIKRGRVEIDHTGKRVTIWPFGPETSSDCIVVSYDGFDWGATLALSNDKFIYVMDELDVIKEAIEYARAVVTFLRKNGTRSVFMSHVTKKGG